MYDFEEELSDQWRYRGVGRDTWKLDNHLWYDPEDDIIDRIDGREEEEYISPVNGLELLEVLPENLKDITYRYYWLGETQSNIGKSYGVKRSWICQLLSKARKCLKDHWEDDDALLQYLEQRRNRQ